METEELLRKKRELLEKKRQILAYQESLMYEPSKPSSAAILANAVGQGASLGFKDEIEALGAGAKEFVTTPGSFEQRKEAFDIGREQDWVESQIRNQEFQAARPMLNFSGEAAGGMAVGGAGARQLEPVLRNVPALPRMMGIGSAEGAAYGAGTAQPGERLAGAGQGAILGGTATPVVGAAGSATMSVLRPAAKRLGDALLGSPRNKAVREIMSALDADDITRDEAIALMRQMGPNAVLADIGPTTQRAGRAVTSQMGPGASQARRFLDTRQRQQQMQLQQAARRAAGADDFDSGIIDIVNRAESEAGPIYDEVFEQVLDVTPAMLDYLKRPAMITARRRAGAMLRNEGFSTEIVDDVTDVRYMDAIKRALDDQIGSAVRAGNNNQARVLTTLKRDFVSELDSQVPRYAEARNVFSGESAMREAAELGRTVFSNNRIGQNDAMELFTQMTDSERQAARIGFLEWLNDEMARTSVNRATVANKFEQVPRFRNIVRSLFEDQTAVQEFLNTAATEAQFSRTRNFITGGSPTARIQADRGALTSGLLETAVDASVSPTSAIGSVLRLVKGNTQLTPEVLEEMGNLLFNPNVVPRDLRESAVMAPFNIPRMRPTTAAGVAGGFVGSQVGPYDALMQAAQVAAPGLFPERRQLMAEELRKR